ncbi:ATP-dependent DNA helicase [Actinoalloteichus caeruleus]|uniref:ATP-dependent DNA helicase n=2 Tax=Actinoalloteichus cyanogriseus TaxID=2893586 RepID=UPI0004BEEF57|nr:ATP-dependent DNA helicase [Actinoalloteichus caeruleus]
MSDAPASMTSAGEAGTATLDDPEREPTPRSSDDGGLPPVDELLTAAVAALGGAPRPGQQRMAQAVARAVDTGEHLAVQAGTGTGKSLAYLVPALRHAVAHSTTVVVSTATIALQRQLVDRDLPRLAKALAPLLGREPTVAILKGRRNYLCLNRVHGDVPDEPEGTALFDAFELSALSRQVRRLHEWSSDTETGDRDELVPGVPEQAWRQVSVTAKECLGMSKCPVGSDCFAERARAEASRADIVVTNHALLAIDAMGDAPVLPEHEVVIVDEAHDLVDRVTSVATVQLTAAEIATAVRRCGRLIPEDIADRLAEAGDGLALTFEDLSPGELLALPPALGGAVAAVRDAAHACLSAFGPNRREDAEASAARKMAVSGLDELHDTAVRLLDAFEPELTERRDVVWLTRPWGDGPATPPALRVAPIGVGGLLREKLFGPRTVVLTSATLTLGGSFDTLGRQWGLPAGPRPSAPVDGVATEEEPPRSDGPAWSGLDVGSPFDHPRSGILYVARHLPKPGRDGLPPEYLDELAELVTAAGGRTLGLFSSTRAAKQAAEVLRERVDVPLLCQGDDSTPLLVREFSEDPAACLFGTLSLWQGVDVPGPSLQLVVMDRIPFPRPDDPLATARQRAVAARGGNGFLSVAGTHAALLLAQGAGRLLRSVHDRGVVAVLDPRLMTAGYGGFLRASLPPFWPTTDPGVVRGALERLRRAAED